MRTTCIPTTLRRATPRHVLHPDTGHLALYQATGHGRASVRHKRAALYQATGHGRASVRHKRATPDSRRGDEDVIAVRVIVTVAVPVDRPCLSAQMTGQVCAQACLPSAPSHTRSGPLHLGACLHSFSTQTHSQCPLHLRAREAAVRLKCSA